MAWMTMSEAAAVRSCSERTIRRLAAKNELRWKRVGRHKMVDVPTSEALETVTGVGRQLAELGTAAAVQADKDDRTLAAIMDELTRSTGRAERAEARFMRAARMSLTVAATVLIVGVVAGSWAGWRFHTTKLAHVDEVHQLRAANSDKLAGLERTHAVVSAKLEAKIEASDTAVETLEVQARAAMTRTNALTRELEASRTEAAQLRADLDRWRPPMAVEGVPEPHRARLSDSTTAVE